MPLESIDKVLLHTPFRRAGKKRITFTEWMRERDTPLPEDKPTGGTIELTFALPSLETCKLISNTAPKGTALL
jgi:hypothetical protein